MNNNVKKAIPMIMLIYILSGTLIQSFSIISPQLARDFNLAESTVSLQASVSMLTMGVASIIYATLSDYISVRKLFVFGVITMSIGSILGFICSNSFIMVVISRAIQTFGGVSASALLIITATKYFDEKTQVKYFGYSTACFQASMAFGVLAGGFLSTYLNWKILFLFPLILLPAIPVLLKYLPEDSAKTKRKLDFIGIGLISIITLLLSLFFNNLDFKILLLSLVCILIFAFYIIKNDKAFITKDFFQNKKYLLTIVLLFFTFSIPDAFSFVFAFLAQSIYEINLDTVSLLMFPSFIIGTIIGIVSGRITINLGVRKTIILALGLILVSLLIGSIFIESHIAVLAFVIFVVSAAVGLLYTPFINVIVHVLPQDKVGTGIGFFTLMLSVASSMEIALTGKLLSVNSLQNISLFGFESQNASLYSNILLIFVVMLIIGLSLFLMNKKALSVDDKAINDIE